MLASKSLTWFPVTVSIFASYTSAVTLISVPSGIYNGNIHYIWIIIPWFLGACLASHTFFKIFYRLDLETSYDYLQKRFDSLALKRIMSGMFIIVNLVIMGIILYAPSLSFAAAVDTQHTWVFCVLSGVVITIYSTIGGLKAVVWVDVIQAFIMIFVQTIILIKSMSDAGGFSSVLDYNQQLEINKITWPNFKVNVYEPNNFWNMIMYGIYMMGTFTINQISMQRLLACKSIQHGQKALYMTAPFFTYVTVICCGIGLCLAKIYQSADLVEQGKIGANDQILTYYVASDYFSGWTGFLGLYSAALYSGAISTVSSAQAALAQITLNDFVIPIHKFWQQKEYSKLAKQDEKIDLDTIGNSEGLTAQQKLNLSKILMAVYGTLSVILAFVASNVGDLLRPALSIAASFTGPFLAIFIVASLKKSTAAGCMVGGLRVPSGF